MTHPEARAFWDRYVPVLIEQGIATATDAPRLQMMAEAWALLRIATKALNKNPINKDTRIAYAEYSPHRYREAGKTEDQGAFA